MPTPTAKPVDLAQRLADPVFRAEVEQAVASMPPERAAELVEMLEQSLRRRKIELVGYLAAAVVLLLGMVIALYVYGTTNGSSFVGWIFLVPLALAGLVMTAIGRWARGRSKTAKRPSPGATPAR